MADSQAQLDSVRTPVKVLSLNSYTMGHISYHEMLEKTFKEDIPSINFRGVKLPQFPHSIASRIAYRLLVHCLPICTENDWTYTRFRFELGSSMFGRCCLDKLLKEETPDVLHMHTQSVALLSLGIMKKIPTVIGIDSTAALLARDRSGPAIVTSKPIIELERKCFAAAAHIISWNDRSRLSVIQDYGISPDKVSTVRATTMLDSFLNVSRRKSQANRKIRLLFVGNDFLRKGGEDLLSVYSSDFADVCELDLVTNAQVSLPDLPGLRLHRGLKPLSKELIQLYHEADIFVMPTHEDAYGLVFIEAMAASLPSIGTNVMAVPELVRDGSTGILIERKDRVALSRAIRRLVDDADLRTKLGENARLIALKEFDNVANCRVIAKLFTECARSSQR